MWKFVGEFRWTTNSKIEQGGDEIEKNPSNPKEEGLSLSLSRRPVEWLHLLLES